MVFGELQSLGLGVILLFLLPGLAGMKTYLWQTERSDQFNRLDTIGISFIASLFALGLLYLGYWIYLGWPPNILFGDAPLWTELKPHVDTVPEYVSHYASLYVVTVVGGLALGCLGVGIGGDPAHRTEIWEYHFKHVTDREEDRDVRLVTTDGDVIDGKVDKFGESVNTRDLVLEEPRHVRHVFETVDEEPSESREEHKRLTREGEWDGQLYVHNRNIARVYFEEPMTADEDSAVTDSGTEPDNDAEMEELTESADSSEAGEDRNDH